MSKCVESLEVYNSYKIFFDNLTGKFFSTFSFSNVDHVCFLLIDSLRPDEENGENKKPKPADNLKATKAAKKQPSLGDDDENLNISPEL